MNNKKVSFKIVAGISESIEDLLPLHTSIQDFKTVKELQIAQRDVSLEITKDEVGCIVHFGMNSRLKNGTPAAKPAAREVFGGEELNPQLCKSAQNKFGKLGAKMTTLVRHCKNSKVSCLVLEYCKQEGKGIFFHLNLMDDPMINAIFMQDTSFKTGTFRPVTESVSAQELYYIYSNWKGEEGFNRCTTFLRNFKPVQPPWESISEH